MEDIVIVLEIVVIYRMLVLNHRIADILMRILKLLEQENEIRRDC